MTDSSRSSDEYDFVVDVSEPTLFENATKLALPKNQVPAVLRECRERLRGLLDDVDLRSDDCGSLVAPTTTPATSTTMTPTTTATPAAITTTAITTTTSTTTTTTELLWWTKLWLMISAESAHHFALRRRILLLLPFTVAAFASISSPPLPAVAVPAVPAVLALPALPALSALRRELSWMDLLQHKHGKSGAAWFHRKWILQQMVQCWWRESFASQPTTTATATAPRLRELVHREVRICDVTAEQAPRNYHSWAHRVWLYRWLLVGVERSAYVLAHQDHHRRVLREELEQQLQHLLHHWIPTHLTDYSASSCFVQLLHIQRRSLEQQGEQQQEASETKIPSTKPVIPSSIAQDPTPILQRVRYLMERYPDHISLWYLYWSLCRLFAVPIPDRDCQGAPWPAEMTTFFERRRSCV